MKLKKGLCLVLSMSILMTFTIRSHAQDKEFININITTEEELFNDNDIKLSRSSSSPSVKDDNLDELTRKRDFLIRENYPKLQYQFVHFLSFLPKYQNLT